MSEYNREIVRVCNKIRAGKKLTKKEEKYIPMIMDECVEIINRYDKKGLSFAHIGMIFRISETSARTIFERGLKNMRVHKNTLY